MKLKRNILILLTTAFSLLIGISLSACYASIEDLEQENPTAYISANNAGKDYGLEHDNSSHSTKGHDSSDLHYSDQATSAYGKTDSLDEAATYTSKNEVAAYIHKYSHLPSNYITKAEARTLGWVSSEKNLWTVAYGKSVGGDYFNNYEGQLPTKNNRKYYECDIDYKGGARNAKRIVYSNDGLIYYTNDHYNTYQRLY